MNSKTSVALGLAVAAGLAFGAQGARADTTSDIIARGSLLCSANTGSYFGFAEVSDSGEWSGFDISFCKALATTILNDPSKVTYVPVSWAQRFPALQGGELDVVIKFTTWTLSRDAELGVQFSLPYFFAGTQIMVPSSSGIEKISELDGATGCGIQGSSSELLLADYFGKLGMTPKSLTFENAEEALSAYLAGRCDYYAASGPTLAVALATKGAGGAHKILPEQMSNDMISAAVRQNDDHFLDLVNWTFTGLIEAEVAGITAANVDEVAARPDLSPTIARMLGVTPGVGAQLGLRDTWLRDVIRANGNYGEIYDRTLGTGSPYKLDRGFNKHWSQGGLLTTPVFN